MGVLREIGLGVVGSLIAAEVVAHAPSITRWLVGRAVRGLPEKDKARYSEEWLAHAEELSGSLAKLRHGLACYLWAARQIKSLRKARSRADRVTSTILVIYIMARLSRAFVPGMIGMILKGKFNNAKFTYLAVRILSRTLITESVFNKKHGAALIAALDARRGEIEAILKPVAVETPPKDQSSTDN